MIPNFAISVLDLEEKYMCWQARERIISKIRKTIDERRQQGSSEASNGVLGRILDEENLPDETISDFVINLLFAGNETTAKTMLFAAYFITQSPKAMKQLLVLSKMLLNVLDLVQNFYGVSD